MLPLKGANLVARYPDYLMREVGGDNDILFGLIDLNEDSTCFSRMGFEEEAVQLRERALRVMEGLGYVSVPVAEECHLNLGKDPGLCFELHDRLFSDRWTFAGYYRDPRRLAQPIEGGAVSCGVGMELGFPPEDEYVYLMRTRASTRGTRALACERWRISSS
ncbi:nucleotidyltransferase family protein [Olsenella uli]|uniref:nucleotidyltransferase family protein n=1 Tax=Olsenella uli TaxID=133926 RepID=UPI001956FDCC|nr:nucleotidyltransferase family protein [Olsenella uli]